MAHVRFRDRSIALRGGESVLEALEREGEVLPSSCRVGVCQSCVVKGEGAIPPAAQEGLKDSWKKQGLLLACVCRPTDDLTIALPTDVIREVPAKLVHKQQVSEDVVILRFEIAREHAFPFESGQFVHLVRSDGLTRPYSIASVPADGYVELHVRRVRDGAMSRWLYDQIPVGEPVRLRGPNGDCCYAPEHPDAPIVLIGSGTGLAPLVGVLREALAHAHRGPIHLFHAGRTTSALYLHDELAELSDRHPGLTYVGVLDAGDRVAADAESAAPDADRPRLEVGRLAERVAAHVPDFTGAHVYFCGNPGMVDALKAHAYKHGAELDHLHADSFVSAPAPTAPEKRKLHLPILGATKTAARGERTLRQKLRLGVQAAFFLAFILQGVLYYAADSSPSAIFCLSWRTTRSENASYLPHSSRGVRSSCRPSSSVDSSADGPVLSDSSKTSDRRFSRDSARSFRARPRSRDSRDGSPRPSSSDTSWCSRGSPTEARESGSSTCTTASRGSSVSRSTSASSCSTSCSSCSSWASCSRSRSARARTARWSARPVCSSIAPPRSASAAFAATTASIATRVSPATAAPTCAHRGSTWPVKSISSIVWSPPIV